MYHVQRSTHGIVADRSTESSMFGNRLLDALSREEVARISPYLRRVFLHRGQALQPPDEPGDFIYFPVDALLWSWTTTTQTERPTSLLMVGRAGAMPLHEVLETSADGTRAVVASPGSAWALNRAGIDAMTGSPWSPLRRSLLRFSYATFVMTCCRLACNSEHNVDKRIARWLLSIMDETGKPEASLTHQQLADIAAIRRPSVSLAFSDLQRHGIVRVHHGLVQILDRERLEREACPCYHAMRDIFESSLRPNDSRPRSGGI